VPIRVSDLHTISEEELFLLLDNDDKIVDAIERHFVNLSQNLPKLVSAYDDNYSVIRVVKYIDKSDWNTKISLGIAWLPIMDLYQEDDDEKILNFFKNEVGKLQLKHLINDIIVNDLQLIDSKLSTKTI